MEETTLSSGNRYMSRCTLAAGPGTQDPKTDYRPGLPLPDIIITWPVTRIVFSSSSCPRSLPKAHV